MVWVHGALLALRQEHSRRERLARAVQELQDFDGKLAGQRPRRRSRQEILERVESILRRNKVARYLRIKSVSQPEYRLTQTGPGRPGPETRYRRQERRRWRLEWTIDKEKIAYDRKSDGMYPLLTNDVQLTSAQVLQAHKRQPTIEKRFEQIKSVFEIAPVLLKNEGRIEALYIALAMCGMWDSRPGKVRFQLVQFPGGRSLGVPPGPRQFHDPGAVLRGVRRPCLSFHDGHLLSKP